MKFQKIGPENATDIAILATALTTEIIERTQVASFDIDQEQTIERCQSFLRAGLYHVIAVIDHQKIIGFAAMCETQSLYAGGSFGIVQELYVLPEYRSQQVGSALIEHIVEFAKTQHWVRLELCTPPIPQFDQTVSFYQNNGFEITGGYKMKRLID